MEPQQIINAERTRIARDLHDYLGAALTEIGMLAGDGEDSGAARGSSSGQFRVIQEKVNGAISDLDALVWALDPRKDTLRSLASYLASFAEEYIGAMHTSCRVELCPQLPDWPIASKDRHHVYLAAREAIHNAVRHAHATGIIVAIAAANQQLRIRITDDGAGFDPGAVMEGNGLSNMRERLASIGGRCEIASQPRAGTTVSICLPLSESIPAV